MSNTAENLRKFVNAAVLKQHKIIGLKVKKFEDCDTTTSGWYQKHAWTSDVKAAFKKWFVAEAKKRLGWSKSKAEAEFSFYDLSFGWRDTPNTPEEA